VQSECQSEPIVLRGKRCDALRVSYGRRRRRLPPGAVALVFNSGGNRSHLSFILLQTQSLPVFSGSHIVQ